MEWRYYNHAMLPTTAPHQEVDIGAVEDGSVWKLAGGGSPCWHVGPQISIVGIKQNGGI